MRARGKTKENITRLERQQKLKVYLKCNPFLTDEDIAQILKVSVQTIRLDRLDLKIPELRERLKNMVKGVTPRPRALSGSEMVGDLVYLEVGSSGMSLMPVTPEMTLSKTRALRGHYLFAQANSLAVAVMDAEVALTGVARVDYKKPVYFGDKVLAKAVIRMKKGNKYMVKVTSYVKEEVVFLGRFLIVVVSEEEIPQ